MIICWTNLPHFTTNSTLEGYHMAIKKSTRKITLDANDRLTIFFKENESNQVFSEIESKFNVSMKINSVGMLVLRGDKSITANLEKCFNKLKNLKRKISLEDIYDILNGKIIIDQEQETEESWVQIEFRNKTGDTTIIKPKTINQNKLIEEILSKKVIFANGSSGTGKTLIAVCVALKMLEKGEIRKIWITRPNLPSESFGFLPGNIDEKMLPFFLPIYNMIDNLVGSERRIDYIEKGKIEILPVAFARGMNIGAMQPEFLIVDESENLTLKQMFLMLSRIGSHKNSKIILCGDAYQSDLGHKDENSLSTVEKILKGSKNVAFITFDKNDVVRSREVQEIVEMFEKYEFEKTLLKKK